MIYSFVVGGSEGRSKVHNSQDVENKRLPVLQLHLGSDDETVAKMCEASKDEIPVTVVVNDIEQKKIMKKLRDAGACMNLVRVVITKTNTSTGVSATLLQDKRKRIDTEKIKFQQFHELLVLNIHDVVKHKLKSEVDICKFLTRKRLGKLLNEAKCMWDKTIPMNVGQDGPVHVGQDGPRACRARRAPCM
ncbi:hypothetical protein LSAT2_026717 [Lamellibrachia satsuma]|nr:hypothetical protein LSAT2_026717 [Lamellibrachia satsuma]